MPAAGLIKISSDKNIDTARGIEFTITNAVSGLLCIEIKTNKFHYPGIEEKISQVMTSKEWPFTYWYASFNYDSLRIMHEYEPDAQYDLIQKNDLEKYQIVLDSNFIEGLHPSSDWVKQHPEIVKNFKSRFDLGHPIYTKR